MPRCDSITAPLGRRRARIHRECRGSGAPFRAPFERREPVRGWRDALTAPRFVSPRPNLSGSRSISLMIPVLPRSQSPIDGALERAMASCARGEAPDVIRLVRGNVNQAGLAVHCALVRSSID